MAAEPRSRLFDRYIMIDWSSTNGLSSVAPKKDAVWMAVASTTGEIKTSYFRSRAACVDATLRELGTAQDRVLVGFDFPYGYPTGFASALDLRGGPAWKLVWGELTRRITDDERNRNNRFHVAAQLNALLTPEGGTHGPFWGRPSSHVIAGLDETCPYQVDVPFETRAGVLLHARRLTETRLPGAQSAWKLYTAGSVGGQALVGIPCVASLRKALDLESRVWPFETGFTAKPAGGTTRIIHAEIWPSVIDGHFPLLDASRERDRLRARLKKKRRSLEPSDVAAIDRRLVALDAVLGPLITDQLQVRFMCEWARTEDAAGTLGARFDAPPALTSEELSSCLREEGWVLGAH